MRRKVRNIHSNYFIQPKPRDVKSFSEDDLMEIIKRQELFRENMLAALCGMEEFTELMNEGSQNTVNVLGRCGLRCDIDQGELLIKLEDICLMKTWKIKNKVIGPTFPG